MAQADAEIDREFEADWAREDLPRASCLAQVSRLARASHTTYGKFVSAHSEAELAQLVEQLQERGADR